MTRRAWRALAGAGLILAAPLVVSPAAAQFQAQIAWCGNKTHSFSFNVQIGGCTALIESGKLTGKPLAWAHNNRGVGYKNKGDVDRAFADYDRAIELDPEYALAFYNRANARDDSNDHDRAIADYGAAIRLDPKYADAFVGRCAARAEAGRDLQPALADCNEALGLRPNDAGAIDTRGFVYLRLGQLDSAIADYDAALRLNPRLASALYGRGLAKQKKSDSAGGSTDIAAAKAIQPNIADVFAGYGVK